MAEAWPHPCHHYYEERLGKRPDAPEIHKRLLDAAGSSSPKARRAMERLADLLALGHTWSQAETIRQSKEFAEICDLVKATDSRQAALNLLLQALHENDERVSWSATEKFPAFDPTGDAVESLVRLLDTGTRRVRAGAARALWLGYGAKAAPAAAALARCVTEADPDLKHLAILALGDIGPSAKAAVSVLKSVLTDEDQDMRVTAAKAIWRIDLEPDEVITVFVTVLENGDGEKRNAAAEQLKEMGPWAAAAVPALIKALKDEDWCNRCAVAGALGEIGPKAAPAIAALILALEHDEDSTVRTHAVEALGQIGDPEAIPIFIAALENQDDSIRWSAIGALESLGHKAKAAVPALMRAVKNDEANGWIAASALGAIDAEGISTPVLIETLGDKDAQMRRFAALGLSGIGRKAAAAEKALRDGLHDSDPRARIAAATAYWSVGGKADEAVQVLRADLQASGNWTVQMWAAGGLAEIGPAAKAAVPELVACLKSDTRYVVSSSAEALGKIGPDAGSAVPALTNLLNCSPS